MKNKIVWTMAISILIFAIFIGGMSRLKDNGTFYIKDIEGQREYLDLFPVEGVAGDGTHGLIFRLENGNLSTQFYALGLEEVRNLFFAEREGINGIKKYRYNYNQGFYEQGFCEDVYASIESAPSKDAKIQHKDDILEGAFEDYYGESFIGGETVLADKIDVYLSLSETNGEREARVPTGMTLQDKTYYYTRGDEGDGGTYHQSSFYDMQIEATCIKLGDAYYCMVIPNEECQGKTSLFRIKKENMVNRVPPNKELYSHKEYGDAEILCTFPVDQENRVLSMIAIGDSIGIFRTQKKNLFFEIYDTEGNMIAQDLLTKELGEVIDQTEAEIFVWDDDSVSVYFDMYNIVKEDENSEVWEGMIEGNYQVDEKGLKRLNSYGNNGGKLLSVCRNNLVLDVTMETDEDIKLPYYYSYEVYLTVSNGDTGKILYQGKIETDYTEDILKNISVFHIGKRAPLLEEAIQTQYVDSIIGQRQRQISDVLPINAKGEKVWLR